MILPKLSKIPQKISLKKPNKFEVFSTKLEWRFVAEGKKIMVTIPVFDSIPRERASDTPPVLVINGFGEGEFSAQIPPSFLGENVISVVMPFDGQIPLHDPKYIEKIMVSVPKFVIKNRLKIINRHRKIGQKIRTCAIIARSQGGPSGIISLVKHPRLFHRIALLAPFGFNHKDLGKNESEQMNQLLSRLGFGAFKSNLFDAGNLRSSLEVAQHAQKMWRSGLLQPMFYAALTFDMIDTLEEVATREKISIFVGKDDPVFRYKELKKNLAHIDIHIYQLPGVHETIGSKAGRKQVQAAYEWLKKTPS